MPSTVDLDQDRTVRSASQRRLIAALALLLGGLLLWLALPRAFAAALLAVRVPVIERLAAGEHVPDSDLLGLIASRELALDWVKGRDAHEQRGLALARLAFREAALSSAERAKLEAAISAMQAALAVAPADPRAWMWLAYWLVMLEGDTNQQAAKALQLSIRTGPFAPPDFVIERRLFWSLAHWAFYDEAEQHQVKEQIRLAWRLAPAQLADLTFQRPEAFAIVVAALEEDAGALVGLGAVHP